MLRTGSHLMRVEAYFEWPPIFHTYMWLRFALGVMLDYVPYSKVQMLGM